MRIGGWRFRTGAGECVSDRGWAEWFLVDEAMLLRMTEQMGGVLVDPLKTTIVQNYRCMTTWVVRKRR